MRVLQLNFYSGREREWACDSRKKRVFTQLMIGFMS